MKIRLPLILLISFLYFSRALAQEQAYLHFNKQLFFPGDTVFFKAYFFYNQQPSYLSTNFYVAAYTDDGKLLQQKQYPVFDGSCNGDIILPDTVQGHSIRVRGFSRGLLAADSTAFFEQRLDLLQPQKFAGVLQKPSRSVVQFFAEGGHAIAGLQNQYVIRATDDTGEPLSLSGRIMETGNPDPVDSFFTTANGLGKLIFTPQPGKTYSALYRDRLNHYRETAVDLPPADYYGVLLHMEESGHRLFANMIKRIEGPLYNRLQLAAYYNNEPVYKVMAEMKEREQWVASVSLDSLPAGLLRFVLSDSADRELQSRFFWNRKNENKVEVKLLQQQLEQKGLNEVEISLADSLIYNLSVSVTDIDFSDKNRKTHALTDLQLDKTAFPSGRINNLVFAEGAQQETDLLMQTALVKVPGYSSRLYSKPLDNFLCLQALYRNKNYAMPANNGLTLVIADSVAKKQFFKLAPASPVDFLKEGLVFYDSADCRYQFDLDKEKSDKLSLSRYDLFVASPQVEKLQYLYPDTVTAAAVNNGSRGDLPLYDRFTKPPRSRFGQVQTLSTVMVKSWKRNAEVQRLAQLDERYTSGFFSGMSRGYQFNLIDDKNAWGYTDLFSYLTQRAPGLYVCTDKMGQRSLHWNRGMGRDCSSGTVLLTFIDEVELPDQVGLESLSVTQIAYIKFIPGLVFGSSFRQAEGVLYIYRKKGNEMDYTDFISLRKQKIKGYDSPVDFSLPDYSVAANRQTIDKRTTLFWEPNLILNRQQYKAVFRFYNNDISKKLLLTVEGVNEEGKLVHIEKIIE